MSIGESNRLIYDNCAYKKEIFESTSPLLYQMYEGKHENCNKCVSNKFWRPYDLVDIESELKNITRPNTKCVELKYNPTCEKSNSCTSTFDKDVPVVFAPELCPIVSNNIQKWDSPGYNLVFDELCPVHSGMTPDDMSKLVQVGGAARNRNPPKGECVVLNGRKYCRTARRK